MNLLSINNLAKIGREKPLFTEVSFGIQEGQKAALIGRNGTGKSTLLATIAGVLTPDEGTVVLNKEAGISYLPQTPSFNGDDTIREHIFKSSSPKLNIIREYHEICSAMGDGEQSESLRKRYDQSMLKMEQNDLWNYESQISSILSTLGISDMTRKMGSLSGGMCKKVALAQVLVEDTKLLLLDEPTNHLDIKTIYWLQNYLFETKRAVLMVTHDRWFLDAVCHNIYELARNHIKLYEGNYSQYLEKKETEAEIEANTERRIESVLRFERDWLLRGPCARGTKIKARIQRDMQLINREKFKADKIFSFEVKEQRLGGKVLELHNISKNYPKGYVGDAASSKPCAENGFVPVIKDFSYKFTAGQKIGIFGDNGSGKSTLLNIITGNLKPDTGSVDIGVNTKFGYYTQNPVFKDTSLTVLEYIKEAAENVVMNNGKAYSAARFLEEFGFEGKIQYSPVSTLSGGERKRLYLVRLLISNPNFLILDEPTNDFDIFTMNILEQFLMDFKGCLLVVSHDRYFMDKVADTLFILEEDGDVSGFVGKCSEYIEYLAEKKAEEKKNEKTAKAELKTDESANKETASNSNEKPKKLSFKEQREFEQLEKDIELLENRKSELESLMSGPDYTKLAEYTKEYQTVSSELEQKYSRWEELA
ncbi:MAG: ABC-F family ATP-binding cassette domain-containing protein [Treponema sp.]|uniref:ribosomal protection-like ABC-F family protein n=1 Tax=Treponema sp. TaxID=166 RepID=UPI00298DA7C7|nr:ABC-F family ATP-binding cassette domain-containing protein [Treponema sp.]MCR5385817.1 ABC-F family ATP-binding cassette domain-containing protein [Treponema sp.]